MLQAIFLDRDGVINRERADYVKSWDEFELLPGALLGLSRLSTLGLPIIILTNQSAIGRGLVSAATINTIHSRLQTLVATAGGRIDAFYVCPHHPAEGCACRKPQPGLLLRAAADFNLNLATCVFVGDSITDYQAANAVGCPSILVASGRQGSYLESLRLKDSTMTLVPDFAAAVSVFLSDPIWLDRFPDDVSLSPTSVRSGCPDK